MTKLILLLSLVACGTDPSTDLGEVFACNATMYCDGEKFEITPAKQCEDDLLQANALWKESLDKLGQTTECINVFFVHTCDITGDRCLH